jgi:hypothetical protein
MVERRKKKRPGSHPLEASSRLRARERLTVQLTPGLLDRLRNAVYWTPGSTLAGIVEACISRAIDDMEAARGHPFPQRKEPLRVGRPPK